MLHQETITAFLKDNAIDAAFIQKDENCRYISGFTGADSYLFLTGEGLYLLTDSRYTEQAREEAEECTVVDAAGRLPETVAALMEKHQASRLGVEPALTYRMYLAFHEKMPGAVFSFCEADRLRQIKTAEEIAKIGEACRISDEGFRRIVPLIRKGRTEAELRTALECAMMEAGSEGKSFDTIVASGWRSAYPHGTATGKVIEDGDLVTFDFGAIYEGYHSDMTRTVAVGAITERQRYLYDSVLDCVLHIEGLMKAGLRACDVDRAARDFLRTKELDSYFTHALGHSVGLEIHETPVLAPRDATVLQPGMIETIEPGVYIPGTGGVRIEDTAAIQEDGISILTKFPKTFLCV